MSILSRYLISEIFKPFALVLSLLAVLFGSYSLAGILSDAVNGLIPLRDIAELVALKVFISGEVLIPIALYLSVLSTLSRLYSQGEMSAMQALLLSPAGVLARVMMLAGVIAFGVALLSLIGRPWAYRTAHLASARASAVINFNSMTAGTFYEDQDGEWTVFIGRRAGPGAVAEDVMIKLRDAQRNEVVTARTAVQLPPGQSGLPGPVELHDVHLVAQPQNGEPGGAATVTAASMQLDLLSRAYHEPGYSAVAAPSSRLFDSRVPKDAAELQWRLSTPLSTLLLAALALPLSRTRPRQGRYANLGLAILAYAAYYLLFASARTWVQNDIVPTFPGIWWVPTLLAAALIWAMRREQGLLPAPRRPGRRRP